MNQQSKILVLDLEGSFGHFRKFYTNSSSLTYAFPPPMTIAGILAGVLGYERDSYYELLSSKYSRTAVEIMNPVRKLIQTVNYLLVISPNDVNKSKGSTQVPLELVLGEDLQECGYTNLRYRIYFHHKEQEIMDNLKERAIKRQYIYPPYLGLSELTGRLTYVGEILQEDMQVIPAGEEVKIHTLCPVDDIIKGSLVLDSHDKRRYIKELIPLDFDHNRQIKSSKSFLYEHGCKGIIAKLKIPSIKIDFKNQEKCICWFQGGENIEDLFPR